MEEKIYRLDVVVQEKDYERMLGLLAVAAPYGWEEQAALCGETRFRLHYDSMDRAEIMRARAQSLIPEAIIELEALQKQDWTEAWREFFTPVLCGSRFVVLPPWLEDGDFNGRVKLLIEPKSAFGTGHHATTALCLEAISALADAGAINPGDTFVDVGCGSGILSLAAKSCGLSGLALDIDPLAVDNARENLALNGGGMVELAQGGVEVVRGKKFTLALANILARPLLEMAPELGDAVASGGLLVLSGILDVQAQKVEQAYRECGLETLKILESGEWRAIIMRRGASGD